MSSRDAHASRLLYEPLPDGDHFRVLSLDRSGLRNGRHYHLHVRPIHDGRPYLALSYRWAAEVAQKPILLNGRTMNIMQTVKSFLDLHFQRQEADIFIDCICINQDDLSERAKQVQLMGKIYSNAAKVCIWLGDDLTLTDRYNLTVGSRIAGKYPGSGTRRAQVARKIFQKQYWSRAWVIQELLLPPVLEAYWGRSVLSEEEVHKLATFGLSGFSHALATVTSVFQRSRGAGGVTKSLSQLLDAFCYTEATDGRDKIYALLGMIRETTDSRVFPIDYSPSNTLMDVVCDVVCFCGVHADVTAPFVLLLVVSLKLQKAEIVTSVRAHRETMDARAWVVATVEQRKGDLQNGGADANAFSLTHGKRLAPQDAEDHQLGSTDFEGRREVATAEDYLHVYLPTLAAHGSDTFSSAPTVAVMTSPSPDDRYETAFQLVGNQEQGRPPQIYTCKAFRLATTSISDAEERSELILSHSALESGDMICKFIELTAALALRKSPTGAYKPIGLVYLSDSLFGDDRSWYRREYVGHGEGSENPPRAPPSRLQSILFTTNVATLCELALA